MGVLGEKLLFGRYGWGEEVGRLSFFCGCKWVWEWVSSGR